MGVPRLSDDDLKAIGRVSLNSAHLEFSLRLCVWRLVKGPPDPGLRVTTYMGLRQISSTLRTLYEREFAADGSRLTEFRNLLRKVEDAVAHRNQVVHSAFWPVAFQDKLIRENKLIAENAPYSRGQPPGSAPHESFFMTTAEIEAIADELHRAVTDVLGLYTKLSIEAEDAARAERKGER